jgi:N-acetylneuraminate synthase
MFFEPLGITVAPIIAEIGLAHEGSLGLALAFIDATADAGAEIVKFQVHDSDSESTIDEKFRINFSKQDKHRNDYWKRTSFNDEQWQFLKEYSESKGLKFSASVFSIKAIELLLRLDVRLIKIGSGDLLNEEFAERLGNFNGRIILSTGLASLKDIETSIDLYRSNYERNNLMLMQCTSKYPTPLAESGARIFGDWENRFNMPIGFSDHTSGLSASIVALVHGAKAIERHVNFDLRMFGPDTSSSITFNELEKLVDFREDFELIKKPFDKDRIADELSATKKLFGRSICLKSTLPKGHILIKSDLTLKKPGGGDFTWNDIDKLIGKKLSKNVSNNVHLSRNDIEELEF